MTGKTSGDSSKRVSHDIFWGIHESFTTQGLWAGLAAIHCESASLHRRVKCTCRTFLLCMGLFSRFFVEALGGYPAGTATPKPPAR